MLNLKLDRDLLKSRSPLTFKRKYLNISIFRFVPEGIVHCFHMNKQEICPVTQTICCVVCDKNLWKNCRYTIASTRKCSLWNNDWNSHLIIVICPHTVHTVIKDKRFKVLQQKTQEIIQFIKRKGKHVVGNMVRERPSVTQGCCKKRARREARMHTELETQHLSFTAWGIHLWDKCPKHQGESCLGTSWVDMFTDDS